MAPGFQQQSYGDPSHLLQRVGSGLEPFEPLAALAEGAYAASGSSDWLLPWALSLWRLNRHLEAMEVLDRAPGASQQTTEYQVMRGMVARQLPGGAAESLASYRRALRLDPSRADIYYNLANLLMEDQPEQAEPAYRLSLQIDAQSATAWHNLGLTLNNLQRYPEALAALVLSVQLDPFVADAWCNLGLAHFGLDQFDQAMRAFYQAIALDDCHGASHINMGNTLISVLKPEQALHYLQRGVELETSSANSLWNLSLAYLLLGRFREGWNYYEARFSTKSFVALERPSAGSQPQCLADCPQAGEPELVVWSEQGLGDAIQFGRYFHLLEAAAVPYVFHCRPQLIELFRQWFGLGDRVQQIRSATNHSDPRPQIALLSLPRLFGTELHTIPSVVPYIKAPAPPRPELSVPPPPGGLAVGIVWATNPDNKAMYHHKSMPLELLMPRLLDLINLDLIDLHSIQFGDDAGQLDPWISNERITHWPERLSDFSDTAHVVRQLDLVISVDTAVAHLAGALNRPTWLLLPQNADFRWLKDRSDCPWYPSMRLFRQTNHGDWAGVVNQVKSAFDELFLLNIDALAPARIG